MESIDLESIKMETIDFGMFNELLKININMIIKTM